MRNIKIVVVGDNVGSGIEDVELNSKKVLIFVYLTNKFLESECYPFKVHDRLSMAYDDEPYSANVLHDGYHICLDLWDTMVRQTTTTL